MNKIATTIVVAILCLSLTAPAGALLSTETSIVEETQRKLTKISHLIESNSSFQILNGGLAGFEDLASGIKHVTSMFSSFDIQALVNLNKSMIRFDVHCLLIHLMTVCQIVNKVVDDCQAYNWSDLTNDLRDIEKTLIDIKNC